MVSPQDISGIVVIFVGGDDDRGGSVVVFIVFVIGAILGRNAVGTEVMVYVAVIDISGDDSENDNNDNNVGVVRLVAIGRYA